MEIKKQVLRIMSIVLVLSMMSPVQAQKQKLTRVQLYRKCIAKKCTPAEKALVRADAKRAGKAAGVLLSAAAVAIGVGAIVGKEQPAAGYEWTQSRAYEKREPRPKDYRGPQGTRRFEEHLGLSQQSPEERVRGMFGIPEPGGEAKTGTPGSSASQECPAAEAF